MSWTGPSAVGREKASQIATEAKPWKIYHARLGLIIEDRYKEVKTSGCTPAERRSTSAPCNGAASLGNCQASLGNNN